MRSRILSGKNLLLLLSAISITAVIHAQNSGTILYKETAKLHFNIQGDAPPPPNLPTERNAQMILYFTPDASLYMNDPSVKNDDGIVTDDESSDGEHIRIKMDAPDNRTYCDLKNNQQIIQQDFMQRKFLITKDLKSSDWKITGNQKMILNYPCQEAIRQDSDKKITVWFTTAIPLSTGPSSYCGLPGVVLAVDINNGDQTVTATAVNLGAVDASKIQKPTEGKKVTQEEFNKIRDEKMKEMGVQPGSGNNVIIRINDH
ncbi:MAG: GLPGLI family protein [Chitinophagales bacterium]